MSAAPPFVQVSMSSAGDVADTFATPWVASSMRSETMLIAKLWEISWYTARCDDAARGEILTTAVRAMRSNNQRSCRQRASEQECNQRSLETIFYHHRTTLWHMGLLHSLHMSPLSLGRGHDMDSTRQATDRHNVTSLNDKLAILRSHPPYQVSRSSTFTMQPQAGDAKRDGAETVVSYTSV